MKKLLLPFALILSIQVFSQFINHPVSRAVFVIISEHNDFDSAIYVPEGKLWQLTGGPLISDNLGINNFRIIKTDGQVTDDVGDFIGNWVFSEGQGFFSEPNSSGIYNFIEYDISNQSLGYNEIKPTIKGIQLFPNPTTSKIALNSDKDYEIEIFDMTGNKVMETSGNTIDLSVLSSAMYIVKTLDKMTKETNSYKVVKN